MEIASLDSKLESLYHIIHFSFWLLDCATRNYIVFAREGVDFYDEYMLNNVIKC